MFDYIIIIPYRDRDSDWKIFIDTVLQYFDKYMGNYKIILAEQEQGKPFNRGVLLNIGFKEYENDAKIFFNHDVDFFPTEECIIKYYTGNVNGVESILSANCDTLGGIIKFNKDTFIKMNGYPNNYFGWGVEDKALMNRALISNVKIKTNLKTSDDSDYKNYFNFTTTEIIDKSISPNFHMRTTMNYNKDFEKIKKYVQLEQKMTGLHNLNYKILSRTNISDKIENILIQI